MKQYLLFITAIFIVSFLPMVLSDFPIGHYYTVKESLKTPIDSEFYRLCKSSERLCITSVMLADITVYDYETLFYRYRQTHSPTFCRDLWDNAITNDDKICAIGGCIHQSTDIVSHTKMVPYAIRHALIFPNKWIHPFAEQKLDLYITDNNPEINFDEIVKREDFEKCVPLFVRTLTGDDGDFDGLSKQDLEARYRGFITELTGKAGLTGYDVSFRRFSTLPPEVVLIYFGIMFILFLIAILTFVKRLRFKERRTILNWVIFIFVSAIIIYMGYLAFQFSQGQAFSSFQSTLAKPLSRFVPIGDPQSYIDEQIALTKNFLSEGIVELSDPTGKGIPTDASGEAALNLADKDIKLFQYIAYFIIGMIIIFLLYQNFKPSKQKSYYDGEL